MNRHINYESAQYKRPKVLFDKKFIEDKDNGRVICYVTPIMKEGQNFYDMYYSPLIGQELLLNPSNFKGVATYKPNDIYDLEIAKRIAAKKAIRAYHKQVRIFIEDYIKYIYSIENTMVKYLNSENAIIDKLSTEICELADN